MAPGEVGELVLDADALTELRSAGARLLYLAQLVLEPLVLGDRDGAAVARSRGGAVRGATNATCASARSGGTGRRRALPRHDGGYVTVT